MGPEAGFLTGIQWVYLPTHNGAYCTGNFPITFTQKPVCFGCMVGGTEDTKSDYQVIWNDGATTKSMTQFYIRQLNAGGPMCLAIGK